MTIRECDPEMVQDLPGNEMATVNGEVLVEKGDHTGALQAAA